VVRRPVRVGGWVGECQECVTRRWQHKQAVSGQGQEQWVSCSVVTGEDQGAQPHGQLTHRM
jgi:hypothetical protein